MKEGTFLGNFAKFLFSTIFLNIGIPKFLVVVTLEGK